MAKRDHIRALLGDPRVAGAWTAQYGRAASEDDVSALFENIGPVMREAARDHAELIPGAADIAGRLQARGIAVGSCTGYTREMMADILPRAAEQRLSAGHAGSAPGETPQGRPSPLMLWEESRRTGRVAGERLRQGRAMPKSALPRVARQACGPSALRPSGNAVGLSRAGTGRTRARGSRRTHRLGPRPRSPTPARMWLLTRSRICRRRCASCRSASARTPTARLRPRPNAAERVFRAPAARWRRWCA